VKSTLLVPTLVFLASPLAAQSPPTWHLIPEATFGGSGDPGSEFSDIRGVEVSRNGNVLVLDFKAQNIRVFAPDGKFLKVISRNGEGPGEFGEPNGFARSPDGTIWVNDPPNHRFSVRRDDGEYIKDVPSALTGFGYIWHGYFDTAGRMVNQISVPNPKPSAPNGIDYSNRYHPMLERRSMTSNQADTIPELSCTPPDRTIRNWSGRSARGGIVMGVPFRAFGSIARSPQDFGWCADGGKYAIYRLRLGRGDTLQVIRGKAAPIPVTATERDSAVASAKALFVRSHLDPAIVSPGDIPPVKPVIISLLLDDQNRLWVRLTSAVKGHTRYDVYDAKGAEVGTIDLTAAIREEPVLIRGNKLYAVVLDADDVPSVVRYRIETR
jgi:hypothetical protein